MRLLLGLFLACATFNVAVAQNPIYRIPGLGGWAAAQDRNDIATLRALQQFRELQEALLLQQQREALNQQQRQQSQASQSELAGLQERARTLLADGSKGQCVDLFLKLGTDASSLLSQKGTSVGQFCGCIEQEMLSLITLDLSGRVLAAYRESQGDAERLARNPAAKELEARNALAYKGCGDRLLSQR